MSCLNESVEKKTLNWGLLRTTQGFDYHVLTHQCPSSLLSVEQVGEVFFSLWQKREEVGACLQVFQLFRGIVSVLLILEHWCDLAYSTCLGGTENKELSGLRLRSRRPALRQTQDSTAQQHLP